MSQTTNTSPTGLGEADLKSGSTELPEMATTTGSPQLNNQGQGKVRLSQLTAQLGDIGASMQPALQAADYDQTQLEAQLAGSLKISSPEQTIGHTDSMEHSVIQTAQTSLIQAHLAGSSKLSSPEQTPQTLPQKDDLASLFDDESPFNTAPMDVYDELNDGVKKEISKWMVEYKELLSVQVTKSDASPILSATFTESIPTPTTRTRPAPPSSDHPNTIRIQRAILNGEPSVVNDDKYKYTLMNFEFPDLQPLAWKTSTESDRAWPFFDELIHRPDAKKYPLQNQAWRIFHDERRRDLLQDYLPIYQNDQGTHLANNSEFGLYTFDVGRPYRVWTPGGAGSVEAGFKADYKSPLGGCMYTYKEADVICMNEAEHVIWAAHRNQPRNVIIIDEAFNRRRPAKSTKEFLAQQERKANLNDINIDVQKLEVSVDEYAATRMNLKDALRELKTSRKNEPVSVQNPPRNLLNITDQSHGHWVEGMVKHYTLLSELVQDIDTKIYADLEDLKGAAAIGKPPAVVKHHSDMQKCGQFRIYADRGAISRWHMDQCGVNTFTHLEGNTNDPSEKYEDVVKYWPSFPMGHLSEEKQKEAWEEYANFGEDWRPRPEGGIPVISILKGQMLIQAPGNIHAPITLTDCLFIGGMAWKNDTVKDHIKSFRFTCERTICTNEEVPRQAQEFVVNLQKMVHADQEMYGFSAGEDLQEFDEAIPIIYSSVTMCLCKGNCFKNHSCLCVAASVKCGDRCHENKVFDREKECNRWSAKPIEHIPAEEPAELADEEDVAPAPKKKSLMTGAQMRRLDEEQQQVSQPDVKRQRRQASETLAPRPTPKKISARQKDRLGKPCTNCGDSGIQTHHKGPTGNTLCSKCNKKWVALEKPARWGSMRKAEDMDAVQAQSSAPEAPKAPKAAASSAAKVSSVPATKRKNFDDSDDELQLEVPPTIGGERQKTMAAQEDAPVATASAPRPQGSAMPVKREGLPASKLQTEVPPVAAGKSQKTMASEAQENAAVTTASAPRPVIPVNHKSFNDSDDELEVEPIRGGKRRKITAAKPQAQDAAITAATPQVRDAAAAKAKRGKTMLAQYGDSSPSPSSGVMSPRSSCGNIFNTAGSNVPNPFRQSGLSNPREAIASPATALIGAPVFTPSTTSVAASDDVELSISSNLPSSTEQVSNASGSPDEGASVASGTLIGGAVDNTGSPLGPACRRHKSPQQACYLCKFTEKTEWKRRRFNGDKIHLICAECDVSAATAPAKAPTKAPTNVPAEEPAEKVPATRKAPVKKASAPATAPASKRSRRGGGGPLVEMNMWEPKAAAKAQPTGKMISNVIVKKGKVVGAAEAVKDESSGDKLSVHADAEFEECTLIVVSRIV